MQHLFYLLIFWWTFDSNAWVVDLCFIWAHWMQLRLCFYAFISIGHLLSSRILGSIAFLLSVYWGATLLFPINTFPKQNTIALLCVLHNKYCGFVLSFDDHYSNWDTVLYHHGFVFPWWLVNCENFSNIFFYLSSLEKLLNNHQPVFYIGLCVRFCC